MVALIALPALLYWELSPRNTHPVVNFRVLRNRDLSAALVMFLALGFGLYGGTFIFPLFVQNILGFTPTATGLALMPGGVATGVTAIMCGQLLNRPRSVVNPRVLIMTGMALFISSMWNLGHMTTRSGEPDTFLPLILRGAGLGMLFTPINLAAFSSLKGIEIPQGASMLNLMRQLGGSFGIAGLSTYITRRTAEHYGNLAANAYAGNPAFEQQMRAMTAGLQSSGSSLVDARQGALGLMFGQLQIQASALSFNDAFLLIGISVVLVSPMVFILRAPKPRAAAPTPDMH